SLLAAAGWAAQPFEDAGCGHDLDHDGRPECRLVTHQIYLQFEPDDGALSYAFLRQDGSALHAHQLIGPSSQLISGLGDPAAWDLQAGLSADPAVIPGAFATPGAGCRTLAAAPADPAGISFSCLDGALLKHYRWDGQALQVRLSLAPAAAPLSVRIPLLLDPWRRFSPGWAELYRAGGSQPAGPLIWALQDGPAVQAAGPGLALSSFLDSRPLLAQAEDPNRETPPGHFLPFPLALLQAPLPPGDSQFTLTFTTSDILTPTTP
ncbi:MAG: hypothetical protein ACKOC5_05840, partial [Chloroflexota bacterium]